MIVHHVGTPTADGVAWVSVVVRDDGTREEVRGEQHGLSPLRPPHVEGDGVRRIDAPGLVVRPEGFERTLLHWLGPGVTDRECHRARVTDVRGSVPLCFRGAEEVAGDVRLAGTPEVGATLGAGAAFVAAVAALVIGGRWLARRARDEAREAYLRREL